jgi:Family of unknown function (DUF5683)
MKRFRFLMVFVCGFASLGFSQGGGTPGRSSEDDSNTIAKKESPGVQKSFNLGIALPASLVFPGGGQIYTRHYVKAGLFIASEIGVGLFGYQRYVQTSWLKHITDSIAGVSAAHKNWARPPGDTTMIDSAFFFKLQADSADMERKELQNVVFQSLAWMVGIYYYNVLDALQCTNLFKSDTKKNPATAMWLSAIPGLGLGQVYNGELSKAGMILMVQANMAYLAINYHLIMRDCEKYEAAIDPNNADQYGLFKGPQLDKWEYRRTTAFRNRNMWLWYSLAFYLYGIFDAAVDAHLHDARTKMKLEPDLNPQTKELGLKATVGF